MQEPPWMPRTEEEYRQQVAEDAGPQPDEMVRLQQALDAAEHENGRLHQALIAAQGIIHEGLHGGNPTKPEHQAACRKPSCLRIRGILKG